MNELEDAIQLQTLQPDAARSDWLAVSPQAREFYVKSACQECERLKLGKADWKKIIRGINAIYLPDKRCDLYLATVFGMAFAVNAQER